ncbi:MAG: hypothetical protein AAF329_07470 [Cyanobacteria bacterium P01_A01_bin.17]
MWKAAKLHQLEDNLKALEFEIPQESCDLISKVSAPDPSLPNTFCTPSLQGFANLQTTNLNNPSLWPDIAWRQPAA